MGKIQVDSKHLTEVNIYISFQCMGVILILTLTSIREHITFYFLQNGHAYDCDDATT